MPVTTYQGQRLKSNPTYGIHTPIDLTPWIPRLTVQHTTDIYYYRKLVQQLTNKSSHKQTTHNSISDILLNSVERRENQSQCGKRSEATLHFRCTTWRVINWLDSSISLNSVAQQCLFGKEQETAKCSGTASVIARSHYAFSPVTT